MPVNRRSPDDSDATVDPDPRNSQIPIDPNTGLQEQRPGYVYMVPNNSFGAPPGWMAVDDFNKTYKTGWTAHQIMAAMAPLALGGISALAGLGGGAAATVGGAAGAGKSVLDWAKLLVPAGLGIAGGMLQGDPFQRRQPFTGANDPQKLLTDSRNDWNGAGQALMDQIAHPSPLSDDSTPKSSVGLRSGTPSAPQTMNFPSPMFGGHNPPSAPQDPDALAKMLTDRLQGAPRRRQV
jgi:hypothetical protein